MRIYRAGDRGPEITDIQSRLLSLGAVVDGVECDGTFGPSTEAAVAMVPARASPPGRRARRTRHVGAARRGRVAARRSHAVSPRSHVPRRRRARAPADVERPRFRQRRRRTGSTVPEPTARSGCSSGTWATNRTASSDHIRCPILRRMRPLEAVPSRALVREREELQASRGPIEGRVIAVDVGESPGRDDDVNRRSAQALVAALQAVGADAELLDHR